MRNWPVNRKAMPPQYQRPGQGSKNTRAVWFVPGEKPQAAEVAALCADQFQPAITTAGNILSTWPAGTWSSAKTWPDPSVKRGPIPDHRFFIRELREFPPILQTQRRRHL